MRASLRLLSSRRLQYHLGLSYAAKQSPPFVPATYAPASMGFATPTPGDGPIISAASEELDEDAFGAPLPPKPAPKPKTKLTRWVEAMKLLPAGRGELRQTQNEQDGGWDEGLRERVWKWGSGEDFFAIVDGGNYTHLALSDGVGGWAPLYDPAFYSQALMYHYASAVAASPSAAPWDALGKAYKGVEGEDAVQAGSATAVGVSLEEGGRGRAVNLGDSGITILRRGAAVFETVPQTHFFNCPYQLSKIPPAMRSSDVIMDTPDKGERLEFDLAPGDVLVLYSDGLSDNLPAAQIPVLSTAVLDLLHNEDNAALSAPERAAEHARLLADVLVAAGRNAMCRTGKEPDWKTPFEVESVRSRRPFRGGKVDDICVITAVVAERME